MDARTSPDGGTRSPQRRRSYLAGVRRAEAEGHILYPDVTGAGRPRPHDHHAHLTLENSEVGGLSYSNTRPLPEVARAILAPYRDRPRLLEMGPGAGVACSTISRMLPQAQIETTVLTPINPYLRYRSDDIYQQLHRLYLRQNSARGGEHASRPPTISGNLSPDLVLELQDDGGEQLFEMCRRPFIATQRIGSFGRAMTGTAGPFHILYEYYGPLYYGYLSGRTDLSIACLETALALVRTDGVMLVMASDDAGHMLAALMEQRAPLDIVVASARGERYHNRPWLLAKAESPLAGRLRAGASSWPDRDGGAVWLPGDRFEEIVGDWLAA